MTVSIRRRMDHGGKLSMDCEKRDLINELPDEVLSYIVSLLRLKDAVVTSMISRRWRHLWKRPILTRQNLEFDIPNIFGGKYDQLVAEHEEEETIGMLETMDEFKQQYFVRRVNELLKLHSGNKVDSLKVAFFFDGESPAVNDLDSWIHFATTMGAEVVDLQLFQAFGFGTSSSLYDFPHQVLPSDSSLKHLSLLRCVLSPPSDHFDRFKQLKTLHLHTVQVHENFMASLFSVCLFLESLTLAECTTGSSLIISAPPCLTDLKLLRCFLLKKIEICAANLVSLEYNWKLDTISCIKTPRLAKVFLRKREASPHGLNQFIASCPGLEEFYLLLQDDSEEMPQSVSTFRNLKKMTLVLRSPNFDLGSVLNVLKDAPLLEEFVLMVLITRNKGEMSNLSGFSHNRLRTVEMHSFRGRSIEIELAICILKIATKLEKMVINPVGRYYLGNSRWVNPCGYYDCSDEEDEQYSDEVLHNWKQRGKARVQEKLKVVMTDAQVIIL
ncbi:hypothetical protein ABKV19_010753 [Rosa sericea]